MTLGTRLCIVKNCVRYIFISILIFHGNYRYSRENELLCLWEPQRITHYFLYSLHDVTPVYPIYIVYRIVSLSLSVPFCVKSIVYCALFIGSLRKDVTVTRQSKPKQVMSTNTNHPWDSACPLDLRNVEITAILHIVWTAMATQCKFRIVHIERKWKRKRKCSLMFVVYYLIFFDCSLIFFAFTVAYAWCEPWYC